ncbi:hypothetical protein QYE76_017476 [Lolium multiflorum]|uniref:Uncharacterized protein n=1 Tax=Lolium multiflorum TaxID=4521 RepID=A0AAD8Q3X9_LOLMU|nr:hypothetical protein QYE76_017476 [Lolium multiflorum]
MARAPSRVRLRHRIAHLSVPTPAKCGSGRTVPIRAPTFSTLLPARASSASRARHGSRSEFQPSANDHGRKRPPGRARRVSLRAHKYARAIDSRGHRSGGVCSRDAGVPMPCGGTCTPPRLAIELRIGFRCRHLRPSARSRVARRSWRRARSSRRTSSRPQDVYVSPNWDLWFEVEHDARRHTCFTSATARPRAQPRTPARRAGRRPGGLYIGEQPQAPHQPQAQAEEDDPELQAALAASREQSDLDELAKWPHLAETLRASALEEAARKAQEDAQAEAWAFLEPGVPRL